MDITGRKLFVKALEEEGVDTIFGYPGGTVTDLFDELYKTDSINLILPRHEQGLIHEAEGYAKSTGRVGVCLVTSGPGATNIITGLADAHYDSIPLVCFTGQVPLGLIGNDAFQEVDIVGMTRSITKYGVTVRRREDLGKIIKMAFYIAQTGKPGPVLIDIPKDIQTASGSAEYPSHVDIRGYKPIHGVHIGQLKKAYKMLKSAKKPLILAGGGVNISHAGEKLKKFMEKENVPVVTTIMGKGAVRPLWERVRLPQRIRFISEIRGCMENMQAIKQSASVMFYFPSEQDLTTVLQENCISLLQMHRLYILMWIRLPSRVMWLWMCRWLQMQVWRLKSC